MRKVGKLESKGIKAALLASFYFLAGCEATPKTKELVDRYCDKPAEKRYVYRLKVNTELEPGQCIEMRCPGDEGPSYCFSQKDSVF